MVDGRDGLLCVGGAGGGVVCIRTECKQLYIEGKTKEAWSAPACRKITPGPARQVDTDFEQHAPTIAPTAPRNARNYARNYLKTRTRSKGIAGGQQLASPGRGRCRQHRPSGLC
jgi:hypothetical protein